MKKLLKSLKINEKSMEIMISLIFQRFSYLSRFCMILCHPILRSSWQVAKGEKRWEMITTRRKTSRIVFSKPGILPPTFRNHPRIDWGGQTGQIRFEKYPEATLQKRYKTSAKIYYPAYKTSVFVYIKKTQNYIILK